MLDSCHGLISIIDGDCDNLSVKGTEVYLLKEEEVNADCGIQKKRRQENVKEQLCTSNKILHHGPHFAILELGGIERLRLLLDPRNMEQGNTSKSIRMEECIDKVYHRAGCPTTAQSHFQICPDCMAA